MVMVIDTYKYKGNDQYPSTMIEEHTEEGVISIFFSNFVAIKRKKYGKEDFEATARGHTDL